LLGSPPPSSRRRVSSDAHIPSLSLHGDHQQQRPAKQGQKEVFQSKAYRRGNILSSFGPRLLRRSNNTVRRSPHRQPAPAHTTHPTSHPHHRFTPPPKPSKFPPSSGSSFHHRKKNRHIPPTKKIKREGEKSSCSVVRGGSEHTPIPTAGPVPILNSPQHKISQPQNLPQISSHSQRKYRFQDCIFKTGIHHHNPSKLCVLTELCQSLVHGPPPWSGNNNNSKFSLQQD
jgi:hypothetical protein